MLKPDLQEWLLITSMFYFCSGCFFSLFWLLSGHSHPPWCFPESTPAWGHFDAVGLKLDIRGLPVGEASASEPAKRWWAVPSQAPPSCAAASALWASRLSFKQTKTRWWISDFLLVKTAPRKTVNACFVSQECYYNCRVLLWLLKWRRWLWSAAGPSAVFSIAGPCTRSTSVSLWEENISLIWGCCQAALML